MKVFKDKYAIKQTRVETVIEGLKPELLVKVDKILRKNSINYEKLPHCVRSETVLSRNKWRFREGYVIQHIEESKKFWGGIWSVSKNHRQLRMTKRHGR